MIREAIEVAFAVAVAGQQLRPPLPPPPSLRPFLRFQKLPMAALGPVRKVVETDEEFRSKVMLAATEELVGRAGWLWIHRPEGWEGELAALVADEAQAEEAAGAERAERKAQRRLDAAEQAARTASATAAALQSELDAERRQRHVLQQDHDRAERRRQQLEIELGGARKRLAEAEARLAETQERLGATQARLAEASRPAPSDPVIQPVEGDVPVDDVGAGASVAADAPHVAADVDGDGVTEEPAPVGLDATMGQHPGASALPPALAEALAAAAAASRQLSAALQAASQAAGPSDASPATIDVADAGAEAARSRPAPSSRGPRRLPLRLPGGVWADSSEAALHLLRCSGVLLLVDGYNVAKLGWPQLSLADQRNRLLDALDELAARYGTEVHVIFDGADVAQVPLGRRYLRVEFSPPGVSADDVIVGLAGSLPVERPIVVATNDGEVRAGVKAAGANVIDSEQLLAVARR